MHRKKVWGWTKNDCLLFFFRLFERNEGLELVVANIATLYEDPPSRSSVYSRLRHDALRAALERLLGAERVAAAYDNYHARSDAGPRPITLSKNEVVLRWLRPLTPAEAEAVRFWQQKTRSFV